MGIRRDAKRKNPENDPFGAPVDSSEAVDSSVPKLRGTAFGDLAQRVETLRSAPQPTPTIDLRDDTPKAPQNRRIARALQDGDVDEATLAAERAKLPPLPDPITEESACDWLRQVVPMMDAQLRYTKALVRLVQNFDYRQSKAKADN